MHWVFFFSIFFFSSCCRFPDPKAERVSQLITSRSGYSIFWDRKNSFSYKDQIVESFLQDDLTLEQAVQIALLNSPRIQAMYENVGIAQGEWLDTCLFKNPLFFSSVRFPDRNTPAWKTEFDLVQPLIRILTWNRRRKMAFAEFYKIEAEVADAFFAFIEEVGKIFFNLQAIERTIALEKILCELAELNFLTAEKQYEVGNISSLQKNQQFAEWVEVRLEEKEMQMQQVALKEEFAAILGLPSPCFSISLDPTYVGKKLDCAPVLCSYALSHRMDLCALRFQMEQLSKQYGLHKWWMHTEAGAGISFEKEPEGDQVLGPAVSLEIPIFDSGQAERIKSAAAFQKTYQEYLVKRLEIIEQTRQYSSSLSIAKEKIDLIEQEMLPNQRKITDETIRLYNFMNAGVASILLSKMREIKNEQMLVAAYREYGVLEMGLRRALGGGVPE